MSIYVYSVLASWVFCLFFALKKNVHSIVDGVCTQGMGEFSKCEGEGLSSNFHSTSNRQWSQQQRRWTKRC